MSKQLCKCVKCDTILDDVLGGEPDVQPMDGLAFVTTGHYGSTVFDPMDGTYLEIVICDKCLVRYFQEVAPHIVEEWNIYTGHGDFVTHTSLLGNIPRSRREPYEHEAGSGLEIVEEYDDVLTDESGYKPTKEDLAWDDAREAMFNAWERNQK